MGRCCLLLLAAVACSADAGLSPPGLETGGSSEPGTSDSSGAASSGTTSADDTSGTTGVTPGACVVFVSAGDGEDGGDGRSWDTAKQTVSAALEVAEPDTCALWIAAGVYRPTSSEDRTLSFELFPGAELYGGFDGTEASLDERDLETSRATLSGDIGQRGDRTDNTHHVLLGADGAVLDGLIVEDGDTGAGRGPDAEVLDGSGLLLIGDSMRIANTTFRRNNAGGVGEGSAQAAGAGGSGGAVYAFRSGLVVEDSEFVENSAGGGDAGPDNGGPGGGGGALAFEEGEELRIVNSIFSGNRSGDGGDGEGPFGGPAAGGGAVRFNGESLRVENSSFEGNRTGSAGATGGEIGSQGGNGGAIAVLFGPARIEDSTFIDNRTGGGGDGAETGGTGGSGGAVFANGFSELVLARSRFEDNETGAGGAGRVESGASGLGGAVFVRGSDAGVWIASCVFDENRTGDLGQAGSDGGALAIIAVTRDGPFGATRVVNSTFSNNSAHAGGAVFVQNRGRGTLELVGNAFGGNSATVSGGALAYEALEPTGGVPALLGNSVLWANTAPVFAELQAGPGGTQSPLQVESTSIRGGCLPDDALECGANTNTVDPGFTDVAGGDLRPLGSVLIDLGDDELLPPDVLDLDDDGDVDERLPFDLGGGPRVVGASVDLGPYEGR